MALGKIDISQLSTNVALLLKEGTSASPQIRAAMELLLSVVVHQAEQLQLAREQIQGLRDEIAVLKGNKPRPKIPKSTLEGKEKKEENDGKQDAGGKRPGSAKRSKTAELEIHETVILTPEGIKPNWIFKGFSPFVVQGLIIEPHNIKYQRGRWLTPEGGTVIAPLPAGVSGHFDSTLVSYVQHQYHTGRVTEPLILEQLRDFGIDISAGQINEILTEDKEEFHAEAAGVLAAGLTVSSFIQVDDTGLRHEGKNGYCTCIGNDLFAYFSSSGSKSRINFLELLRAGHVDYVVNNDAVAYMRQQGLMKDIVARLADDDAKSFADKDAWQKHLADLGVKVSRHVQIATEAALLASALAHGLSRELVILSDDAGQFNVLIHALCWVHAERIIHKLIGFTDDQRTALASVRDQIWALYQKLKSYREAPSENLRQETEGEFDRIFEQKTCFETLNQALSRLRKNKPELLRVLDYPVTPLHNNGCETDVRDPVTKRKVSGGTQSALGRRARDTFLTLKRTCRKLGQSFWDLLNDRNSGTNNIPLLGQLIIEKARDMR